MINLDGWVSINRKLTEHWLWTDKPFSKGQAWIDLIMLVNHEDKKTLHGNEIRLIKRGERLTSITKLADRWGWSRKKVFDFLNVLESEQMIERKSNSKETVVTIVKYDDYQSSRNTEETQKKRQGNTKETPKSTNNNENNDNNILPKGNKEYVADEKLNQALLDFIDMRKRIKAPMTDKAIELTITKLKKLSGDIPTQIAIINQSIEKSWRGVFPLSDTKAPTKNKQLDFPQRQYSSTDMSELERKLINKD